MIVTITPTPLDGTVLRWYPTESPQDAAGAPIVTVSRNRIEHDENAEVPEQVQRDAIAAYARLKRNPGADVRGYATHYRTRRGLVPITKAGE